MKLIEIDEKACAVQENLWQALVHLRAADDTRVLWVDAVCINQQNIDERNHQVMQMGEIYRRASKVVVWLGLSDPTSHQAIRILEEVSRWKWPLGSLLRPGATSNGNRRLRSIQRLFLREYWGRLWIIQEILMAEDLSFHCGYDSFTFDAIGLILERLGYRVATPPHESSQILQDEHSILRTIWSSLPSRLSRDRSIIKGGAWGNLNAPEDFGTWLGLCCEYGESGCNDPRDKIFGLHNLASPCCRNAVTVDYSASLDEVYQAALLHHMQNHSHRAMHLGENDIVLHRYQQFHQSLGISVRLCRESATLQDLSENLLTTTQISGRITGQIMHISAQLNDKDTALNLPPLNRFSDANIRQLEYIGHILEKGDFESPHTNEIDLVASFCGTFTQTIGPLFRTKSSVNLEPNHLHSEENQVLQLRLAAGHNSESYKWHHPSVTIETKTQHKPTTFRFHQVLSHARETMRGGSAGGCRLAIEESGLICFVPSDTENGDLVCQFESSNILAILGKNGKIIGRAVNFLPSTPNEPVGICGLPSLGRKRFEVHLKLSPRSLQLLTATSATPDRLRP